VCDGCIGIFVECIVVHEDDFVIKLVSFLMVEVVFVFFVVLIVWQVFVE